ncbi:MAG: glucan biosynthesis protein G [Acetobacter sp.]|nr:glucan biosynthesis protein G [Acetobacter sp.]
MSVKVQRRDIIRAGVGTALLSMVGGVVHVAHAENMSGATGAFDDSTVIQIARKLSTLPYRAPEQHLPKAIENLTFDQYRSIVYKHECALWATDNLDFDVEFFPRGFLYKPRVAIYEVVDGRSSVVPYSSDLFTYADPALKVDSDLGFAGFRLRSAINTPGVKEEFCVFLGASYFRAVAKGQNYGLFARGFANDTGDPKGEEFAIFRAFWLEKPHPDVQAMVLYALLDSPSLTGAFRFTIRPGDPTVFDVQTSLFPRTVISQSGIAPLASMYYFGVNDHSHVDDWRPAAHDSEALQMWTGSGQQLYRPLYNPLDLQISTFSDVSPRGFGLVQRRRAFHDFEDLQLHYEKRPSLWIEPVGDWGSGWVELVEIPTPNEVNDNIVSFWRPKDPVRAGREYMYTYRMYWGWDVPFPTTLARIGATRVGTVTNNGDARFFCIDFTGDIFSHLSKETHFHITPKASAGTIRNIVLEPNPDIKGWRATFEFAPGDAKVSDLSATLETDSGPVSEQWLYRWTP